MVATLPQVGLMVVLPRDISGNFFTQGINYGSGLRVCGNAKRLFIWMVLRSCISRIVLHWYLLYLI